jgi:hypothetical protein
MPFVPLGVYAAGVGFAFIHQRTPDSEHEALLPPDSMNLPLHSLRYVSTAAANITAEICFKMCRIVVVRD